MPDISDPYVFNIKKLLVEFEQTNGNGSTKVLNIRDLSINRGRVLFVLGNSGSGKTTLLETLGLMGQHASHDSEIIFVPAPDIEPILFRDVWNSHHQATEIRRHYFSFMFQSTQLFPNYSLKENVALTQIIKQIDKNKAIDNATEGLSSIGMESEIDKPINKLSGGQVQRAAFVRAALAGGRILFADEPTGNLGDIHAHCVMQNIRDYVDNSAGAITAIIVTHNVNLALQYGDDILVLKKGELTTGKSLVRSYYSDNKKTWPTLGEERSVESTSTIESIQVIQRMMGSDDLTNEDYHKYSVADLHVRHRSFSGVKFRKFFASRSTHELSFAHVRNHLIIIILVLAFCAIGFSVGSLDVLREKMADPYVNWIGLDVPQDKHRLVNEYIASLSADTIRSRFSISHVGGYNRLGYNYYSPKKRGYITFWGRSVDLNDPLYAAIKKTQEPLRGSYFNSRRDIGIIITEEMANILGVDSETQYIQWHREYNEKLFPYPIPLRGIVKQLPGKNSFLVTLYFEGKEAFDNTRPFYPTATTQYMVFIPEDSLRRQEILDTVYAVMGRDTLFSNRLPYVTLGDQDSISRFSANGSVLTVSCISPELQPDEILLLHRTISSNSIFDNLRERLILMQNIPTSEASIISSYNQIAMNVGNLDSIAHLREFIYDRFGMDIDLAKVESLNNYVFVTRLTMALSIFINVLCILSICVFIIYILYLHLYKNRNYLGLLKAFGVPTSTLIVMYYLRMNMFLLYSIVISFMMACSLGYSGLLSSMMSKFIILDKQYNYFNIFGMTTTIFTISILIFSSLSIYFTARYMLNKPPGDLIYDRLQ